MKKGRFTEEQIIGVLKQHEAGRKVPELAREIGVSDATITMTLTTPHCPVAESLPQEVELRVLSVPGIRDAVVNLVWDPPWDPSKMSDEARLELGML